MTEYAKIYIDMEKKTDRQEMDKILCPLFIIGAYLIVGNDSAADRYWRARQCLVANASLVSLDIPGMRGARSPTRRISRNDSGR